MILWIIFCFLDFSYAYRDCPKGKTKSGCPTGTRDMQGCCNISDIPKKKKVKRVVKINKQKVNVPKKKSCVYSSYTKKEASTDDEYTSKHPYAKTVDGKKILKKIESMRQEGSKVVERMEWLQYQTDNTNFEGSTKEQRTRFLLHSYAYISDLLPAPNNVREKCPEINNRSLIDNKKLQIIEHLKKDEILGSLMINLSNDTALAKCLAQKQKISRKCGYVLAQEALQKYLKSTNNQPLSQNKQRIMCKDRVSTRIFENKGGSQQKFWLMIYEEYCSNGA